MTPDAATPPGATPSSSRVLALEAAAPRPDRSASSSKSGKKRKRASSSASPSAPKSPELELVDTDERTPARKVRKVNWEISEPTDPPAGAEFDVESIDSLWYRRLDYGQFLRQQLVMPADQKRAEDFMSAHGPLRLVKSSIVQMARSTQQLLSAVPSLARIVREHDASNPAETERLHKQLEEKEVELVDRVKEVDRLTSRESELLAQLKRANDLLAQRDRELAVERERVDREALERRASEDRLQREIEQLADAAYACYEDGFDEALAQVKHFAAGGSIDLSKVDREKKLEDILAAEAAGSQGGRAAEGSEKSPIGVEEEEEEEEGEETPEFYPDL